MMGAWVNRIQFDVVVFLLRSMEGVVNPIFRSFHRTVFKLYIIQSTTVSFLDLKDAILFFTMSPFFSIFVCIHFEKQDF